jgi:hypothetical protein
VHATQRAVFVANDGNLEGSVTSFLVMPDGHLSYVDKLVIGMTNSTANPVPGTNAHTISLTPNGRFLAVGHTTAAEDFEQLTILWGGAGGYDVNGDGRGNCLDVVFLLAAYGPCP